MVRAWYMDDNSNSDQRLPRMAVAGQFLDLDTVKVKTGIMYTQLDPDRLKEEGKLDKIRTERNYNFEDCITVSKDKLPNYEEMIRKFFTEHIHSDEEIRYCIDGSGYFDVRDVDDRWIRVEVVKGDLLILPAGIYHRFTTTPDDYIVAMRLFSGVPVWTPFNRPQEDHPARIQYLKNMPRT